MGDYDDEPMVIFRKGELPSRSTEVAGSGIAPMLGHLARLRGEVGFYA